MAFARDLVSILMVCMSYQAVVAHPRSADIGFPRRDALSRGPGYSSSPMQSLSKLSPSCQTAARSLMTGGFGTCANLAGLVSILETQGSIIPSINKWVTGACSSTPCDDTVLASAGQSIKTACRGDLKEQSIPAVALYSVIMHYSETRNIICTQYRKDGGYCLPSVLGNVETRSGVKATVAEVVSMMSGTTTRALRAFISASKKAYCTDCAHAMVTQSAAMLDAVKKQPAGITFEYGSNTTVQQASEICGASFGDGRLPSSVIVANSHSGYGAKHAPGHGAKQDSAVGAKQDSAYGAKQGSAYGPKQDSGPGAKQGSGYGGKSKSEAARYD